ncbi:MAG: hypothetical protein KF760_00365 [Candidatus Eremiobacteraeota bacterium]|nr:hypothetical protein [Candidatus Eremiobacteraeota bacterium]MCW5871914.1 hypothetical protein [Candidatus Eremiobacteraeota bacterium]
MTDLPIAIGWEVLRHFEELSVDYMVVGSVASSLQGIARSTLDMDVLARLSRAQALALVERLQEDFYVSPAAVEEAVRRKSMFNVVQFSSGFKIDVYVLGGKPFEREEFARRQPIVSEGRTLWVATAEDLIISKLDWYRLGGEVSERQWRDVVGLVQLHRERLDMNYLELWLERLELKPLWDKI